MSKCYYKLFVSLFVTALLLANHDSIGQRKSTWLGIGGMVSPNDITFTGDLNFQTGRHLYLAFLADYSGDVQINVTKAGIGLGAGYIYKRRSLLLALSGGATLDSHSSRNENPNRVSIGIPIKLQTYFTTKWIGIGLNGMIKFSEERNYGGIGLVIGLGKMK